MMGFNELDASFAPGFAYVRSKARTYCKIGRDKYRLANSFQLPDPSWPSEILDAIDDGMKQLLEGRGADEATPIEGIGIEAFYALMETLHFELYQQSAFEAPNGFLDKMEMRHRVSGMAITLYNLVDV